NADVGIRAPVHGSDARPIWEVEALPEPELGRDIAPRCLRPRSGGRNGYAAARGADGAAHVPTSNGFTASIHVRILEVSLPTGLRTRSTAAQKSSESRL
ncbi:MAG: hypothetical protein ABI651_10970, partial [Verrucomicrobiota bacterium]